jgi:hypothetical protein
MKLRCVFHSSNLKHALCRNPVDHQGMIFLTAPFRRCSHAWHGVDLVLSHPISNQLLMLSLIAMCGGPRPSDAVWLDPCFARFPSSCESVARVHFACLILSPARVQCGGSDFAVHVAGTYVFPRMSSGDEVNPLGNVMPNQVRGNPCHRSLR